jgi:glycosyltransferase involved in cell wall biosynthesis
MKVALFTDTFLPQVNGVSLTLARLAEFLESKGVSVRIFAPKTKAGGDDFFAGHLHRFASFPFFLYPDCRIAVPNLLSIGRVMRADPPDLIHVATPFNMGLAGLWYSKTMNIPLIASHHTHFERYLPYYKLEFLSGWIWKYLRWFHETCHVVLVPSSETKMQLMDRGFPQVDVWSRGVDTRLFHPQKKSWYFREKYEIEEKFLCLYVGRLAPEKDLDVLTEIIRRMPEPHASQIHWMIVWDGPMMNELKSARLPRTTLAGKLSGEDLAEAYASADLFVFPSSTETFGNVVLEALASGTPAIGADSGGVREIIRDGQTGMLCPPRSAEDFIHAVIRLLTEPGLLGEMSRHARRYALTRSWDSVMQTVIHHYEEAVRLRSHHPCSA